MKKCILVHSLRGSHANIQGYIDNAQCEDNCFSIDILKRKAMDSINTIHMSDLNIASLLSAHLLYSPHLLHSHLLLDSGAAGSAPGCPP